MAFAERVCTLRLPIALFLGLLVVRKWSLLQSIGVTAVVTFIAWLLDFFTPVENSFSVVYISPAAATESQDKRIRRAVGCNLKEMLANSRSLDAHLQDKGLTEVECSVFNDQGKEWVLYARNPVVIVDAEPVTDSQEHPAPVRKKGRLNPIASQLAGFPLHGPAVVLPADRSWKPTVLGRMDMISGAASRRRKVEGAVKAVTTDILLEVYAQTDQSTVSSLENVAATCGAVENTLRKRRDGEGMAEGTSDSLPAPVEDLD